MRRTTTLVALVLVGACHGTADVPPPAPPASPVQHEMQLLTAAMHAAVSGIGVGDVRGVADALEQVDRAKVATDRAIETGAYHLPKNADHLERFAALDDAFHRDLEALAEASRRNDVDATAVALGSVLQRCNGCHSEFRR